MVPSKRLEIAWHHFLLPSLICHLALIYAIAPTLPVRRDFIQIHPQLQSRHDAVVTLLPDDARNDSPAADPDDDPFAKTSDDADLYHALEDAPTFATIPPHNHAVNATDKIDVLPTPSHDADVLPTHSHDADVLPTPPHDTDVLPTPSHDADVLPTPSHDADVLPTHSHDADVLPTHSHDADVQTPLSPTPQAPPTNARQRLLPNPNESSSDSRFSNAPSPTTSTTTADEIRHWNAYARQLSAHFKKFKKYPAMAQRLKLAGTTWIRLEIRNDGSIVDAQIDKSSGHDILDEAALQAARDAQPLPPFPPQIASKTRKIRIPYHFSLKN